MSRQSRQDMAWGIVNTRTVTDICGRRQKISHLFAYNRFYSAFGFVIVNAMMVLALLFGLPQSVSAENAIYIDVIPEGESSPVDTLYADSAYELRVWIGNDIWLGAMSIGLCFSSPDGATWSWQSMPNAFGHITHAITLVPGSRMLNGVSADSTCWSQSGFSVYEYDVDGQFSDAILCGGLALAGGLNAGPLQHMYSYHFIAHAPDYSQKSLFIDSCFVPPAGDFIFCPGMTPSIYGIAGQRLVVLGSGQMNSYCDPAFVVCPGGDVPFHVYLRDEYGDPVVGNSSVWVDFVNCDVIEACPSSEQQFTTLEPVAPSDEDGRLTFYMDGGTCDNDCYAVVKTPTYIIDSIPVRSLDRDGDFIVAPSYDLDASLCNDYDGNGTFNSADVRILNLHAGHKCDLDPCDRFGYSFRLDPPTNHIPGQNITLELTLTNNNILDSCEIISVSFYYSEFGTGLDEEFIQSVFPDTILAPGEGMVISIPYTVPTAGHGCLYARATTPCCSTVVQASQCLQMTQHCTPGENACYEFHLALDSVPIYDRRFDQDVPAGWSIVDVSEPDFPLYSPDTVHYTICTPNLSDLGASTSVTYTVCYNDSCTLLDDFTTQVVITSQTGDANGDCNINVADAVYLIVYIFKGGPAPAPLQAGDPNCDDAVNVGDAVFLVNYIFKNGPPPCYVD